jgi:hypothetical protein
MSRRSLAVVAVLSLAILAASPLTHAQTSDVIAVSRIPFEFVVGEKTFPAGEYRVTEQHHSMPVLRMQSTDGKLHTALTPITRLARQHQGDAPKASFVFDIVGETHILSEVWLSGEDGYLLRGTEEEHRHEVVDVK